jgi:uncharacterized repeat protein (TIGR02543 family)
MTFVLYDCNSQNVHKNRYGYWKDGTYTIVTEKPKDSTACDTLTGGIITGGKCSDGGGVFVNTGSSFIMYGGTIVGNTATNWGGGVYNTGTFTMYGGTITGNTAKSGGGVYNNNTGTFTMYGGTITGNTATQTCGGVYAVGTVNVGGTAKITGNTQGSEGSKTDGNLYLTSRQTITIDGELKTDASIGVTMASGTGTFTSGGGASYKSYFTSDSGDYCVTQDSSSSELQLTAYNFDTTTGVSATGYHKHSVGDTETVFEPIGWLDNNMEAGSYVLTNDVELESTWEVNADITLDLNGHDITLKTGESGSVIQVNNGVTFTLYDCNSQNQHGERHGYWQDNSGQNPENNSYEKFSTYIIKAAYDDNDFHSDAVDVITGGIITGGNATWNGGGVFVLDGTFTMYGGTIAGNQATVNGSSGGGVGIACVDTTVTFTMNGGMIVGNKAAGNGGGVDMNGDKCIFNMTGGTIQNNVAAYSGGGVSGEGTIKLSGNPIIRGNTQGSSTTSNVYLFSDKTISIVGKLEPDAVIGVTMANGTGTGTFTSGWSRYHNVNAFSVYTTNFFPDDGNYAVNKTSDGDLALHKHILGYESINNNTTIKESCSLCDHTATATVSATNGTYSNGAAIETGSVQTSDGWLGGQVTVTYDNNNNASTTGNPAVAKITVGNVTASVNFTIGNASQAAPATSVVSIDYTNETISFDDAYEVNTASDFGSTTAVISGSKVTPGNTYYVRLAAKDNYNASGWTEFTVASRPAKPAGLTATAETSKKQGDGKISGVDSTMEYKQGDSGWTAISGTELTNLAAGTYYVRYKVVTTAGEEAFVSEATQVEVAVGNTLTVRFDSNGGSEAREITDLSYNQAAGTLPTTSRTGYTFAGWYNGSTELTEATQITENVTYTAKWTLNDSTIVGTGYSGTYDEKAHSISVTASHVLTSGLTYSYQWQKLTDETWTDISGATESSYDLTYAAESGSYRCVVTASDGTLTSVTNSEQITVDIKAQETELPENSGAVIKDSEQAKITIDGVSEVPETLVNAGLRTVEEIQEKLEQVLQEQTQTNVTGSESSENQAIYEVALMVSKDSGKTWSLATKENFPADGKLTVVLPYPEGTDSSYVFTAVHMFTTDYFGNTPGDTEVLTTTNTQEGVQVTVTGLSPIALAWTEAPEYPTVAAAYGIGVLDTTNGTVRASVKRAAAGTTVTLTVSPDAGYGLETLTVTTSQGKQVALTEAGAGTYTFRMPASAVTISGTFAQVAAETPEEAPGFQDVDENAYYAEAVAWAVANGITNGTSDTSFEPDGSCTRAQVVTFLWRYAGKPEPTTTESPFTDVEEGSYYYKAVLWAYENGITKGTSDTTFSPDDTCTRAQVVTFLWRYEQEPEAVQAETFTDVAADAYYAKAVAWAVANGITKGTGDGRFSPDETCVRSQVVTFLYRDSMEG